MVRIATITHCTTCWNTETNNYNIPYLTWLPHIPYDYHIYPMITTHTLWLPHIPYHYHKYPTITTYTLWLPHIPYDYHTYPMITTYTLWLPHIPYDYHTFPIRAPLSNFSVFRLLQLYFCTKVYIMATHLNCLNLSRWLKWASMHIIL